MDLNRQLSKATRKYFRKNSAKIKKFLVNWLPEHDDRIQFGNETYNLTTGFDHWQRKYYAWGGKKDPTAD